MALPNPVIFIPGITASYLKDVYPLPPETLWSVLKKQYDRAKMHPDNVALEATQPSLVRPDQLFEIAYEELIEELRYNLSPSPDRPVPVFPFAYDWRQPLHLIEGHLAEFIDEVIARTKLMGHYHPAFAKKPKVNIIAHSMGGLITAGYVESHGAEKIDKIATLATPYNGSFEAIVKMTTGTADMGGSNPSSREREASRVTPALYHLIPDFDAGMILPDGSTLPKDSFSAKLWQPSIIDTVREYVHRYSVTKARSSARGTKLFDDLLKTAKTHRNRVAGLKLKDAGLDKKRWLAVVGTGTETRVRMSIRNKRNKPEFVLTSKDRLNNWGHDDTDTARQTGDGTVHFEGAIPKFLDYESLVCVTPQDYGYWEVADRLISGKAGLHGILPNMNMLHRMLVRYFWGWGDPRGNTWGRSAPGVDKKDWAKATPLKLRHKDPVD